MRREEEDWKKNRGGAEGEEEVRLGIFRLGSGCRCCLTLCFYRLRLANASLALPLPLYL